MKLQNSLLVIRQLDRKMQGLRPLVEFPSPPDGWINLIRKTLNMSLRQLSKRMSITPQSLRDIEGREKEGTVTLKTLRDAAEALNMKLVYGFVPKQSSLEQVVDDQARAIATRIVMRTSISMKLEDQENSAERIKQAIEEMTEDLKREMPRTLWD